MRVTNLVQNTQVRGNIQTIQQQIAELQRQIGTGKKAEHFSELKSQARNSIELRSSLARLESYRLNMTITERRISSMNLVMDRVGNIANEIRDEVLKARNGGVPDMDLINRLAADRIDEMTRLLNMEQDGRYLFAGIATAVKPVLDPAANLAYVSGELAGYNSGNIATKLANIQAHFATTSNYYVGDSGSQQIGSRIDDGLDLNYGLRADGAGFQKIFAGLHMLAELDYDPENRQAFEAVMDGAAASLTSGFNDINAEIAVLGDKLRILETTRNRHEATEIVLETQIGNLEDVDVAEKITTLLSLQTQMESSFNVIGQLRGLNLSRFL